MTEQESLLAAIITDPDENLHRWAYADWLDEHAGETVRCRDCADCAPIPLHLSATCKTCQGAGWAKDKWYADQAAFIRVQIELENHRMGKYGGLISRWARDVVSGRSPMGIQQWSVLFLHHDNPRVECMVFGENQSLEDRREILRVLNLAMREKLLHSRLGFHYSASSEDIPIERFKRGFWEEWVTTSNIFLDFANDLIWHPKWGRPIPLFATPMRKVTLVTPLPDIAEKLVGMAPPGHLLDVCLLDVCGELVEVPLNYTEMDILKARWSGVEFQWGETRQQIRPDLPIGTVGDVGHP